MSFGSVIFSYSVQQGTITWSDCDVWWKVDFIWQLTMTSSVVGLSSSKALPRAKLESTNERSWPLLGSLLPVWSTTVGFNSESQGNHYIWEVCSANQWDAPKTATPAADSGPQKGPNSSRQCPKTHRTTNASNVEQLGYEVLPHLPFHLTSCQLTTTSPSISTTFCRENTSTKRKQKMLSKNFSNPEVWTFYATGINKLISHW